MAHPWRTPTADQGIDPSQSRQVVGSSLVLGGIVLERSILRVAHIFDGDYVTMNRDPWKDRGVRLPVSLVGRLLRKPPDQKQAEDR